MNKNTSKKLRAIVSPEDPVSRRVYRRLKKQYSKLPKAVRPLFLQQTAEAMGIIQQTIDQSQE